MALAALVLSAGILAAAVWAYAITELGAWNEIHHMTLAGIPFSLAYWWCDYLPPLWLTLPLLWIMWDDAVQHWRQMSNPTYRSPVWLAYQRVWVFVYLRFGVRLP